MKVLIPLENDWIYRNPFVGVLNDEFKEYDDVEIITGVRHFWDSTNKYDIIHIYWPQCLLQGEYSERTLDELDAKIKEYKTNGTKIVSTCLNLAAHYSNNSKLNDSYDLVYGLSDTIIHLAEYSRKLLAEKFPDVKSTIIEHHVYDTLYNRFPTKEESYKTLHLSKSKNYILSFGTYRSKEEINFVFKVAKSIYDKTGYYFLIPLLYPLGSTKSYKYYIRKFLYRLKMLNRPYIKYGHDYVNQLLPEYYAVSDISFIQRIKILNSGNVPMGFFWGHVVVGTQDGCVGNILSERGNPTFDYENIVSVVNAVCDAINLSKQGKGEENRRYVLENCTVLKTVEKIYDIYCQ